MNDLTQSERQAMRLQYRRDWIPGDVVINRLLDAFDAADDRISDLQSRLDLATAALDRFDESGILERLEAENEELKAKIELMTAGPRKDGE